MKKRLGLDLGTNSIGWCLLELNNDGNPVSIIKTGVRIFSDGRDPKSLGSLKADRRLARSARRRRDRLLQRQKYLIDTLVRRGLMPEDDEARKALAFKDPYSIRKTALDKEIAPHDMGRAIFHLNQRRGFKSNRKSGDNEAGVVKQSIAALDSKLMEHKARTIGEFLADRLKSGETVRARRFGTKSDDLYELYPDRAMLEKEFDKIWDIQAEFNPKLYSGEAKDEIKHIVFFQRPLKPQEVGKCTFFPDEYRIAKALPSFQRFRIYQELSNLEWIDGLGKSHKITKPLRDRLYNELETKNKLTFKSMHAILRKEGIVNSVRFNLETDLRDHLVGDETSCIMRKILGTYWDSLDESQQDAFISMLLDSAKTDDEVRSYLIDAHGLSEKIAEGCLDAKLPDGHGQLSKKAIDMILPRMRDQTVPTDQAVIKDQCLTYSDAVKEADLGVADPNAPLKEGLEYYGKALSGHTIGGSGEPKDREEKQYGTIPNPTVHIALNQVRAVVNELIRLHGKPDEIVLEIGRDLPMGADGKRELKRFQKQGLEKNNRAREEISKYGGIDSRETRQKFQLWEQLAKDPTDRCCPFTGKVISLDDLFSDRTEIEHLLPFSVTLDDSMANKTVCLRKANRDKGNKSPFEAFGDSPEGYDWEAIMERVKNLPSSKKWRFQSDAMQRFEEEGGFLERQLNDTRYISRYTTEYLSTIVPKNKIWVVTGRLTALLRGHWGLNSVLSGHNSEDDQPKKKSRDDHRHHAVDAVVVAMTSRGLLQTVSTAAGRSEELDIGRLFDDKKKIDPWDGFRDEVKEHIDAVIVSHRPRKKDQGALHNDTAYGLVEHPDGTRQVVHKIPITDFKERGKIEKIRDESIREALLKETAYLSGKELEQAVQDYCKKRGIRSLRILENLSVIPIKDKDGKIYKGYKGDSNAYMEIYEDPKSGKWQSEIVSTFDANQQGFIPEWQKKYPAQKMLMRLRINDMMLFPDTDQIYHIQKMDKRNGLFLTPHTEANADSRHRDKDDLFKFLQIAISKLEERGAIKVHISPTGLISKGR